MTEFHITTKLLAKISLSKRQRLYFLVHKNVPSIFSSSILH